MGKGGHRPTSCWRTGFGLAKPINFVYGVHGVLLVEDACNLFPMITLNVVDALSKDRSLAGGGGRIRRRAARLAASLSTITAAAHDAGLPGGVRCSFFIWTFSDFATPLVLGVHDLLASQAYLNIVQFVDRRLFSAWAW